MDLDAIKKSLQKLKVILIKKLKHYLFKERQVDSNAMAKVMVAAKALVVVG